ncbi:hypothetical protein CRG98_042957 [Punica granatum]|uniref:Uncharacterized protein n=1 Tax=Punica granatum TaxID=22663 RepID=A0A2I0HY75_PUNGR|nr:hypothetical protein CRG98_042957 [Punica granatum]
MATSGRTSTKETQCTSLVEVVLARASTGNAPVYVTCRGCASASFNRGCPSSVATTEGRWDPFCCWRCDHGHTKRCVSEHAVTLSVKKKLALVSLAWEGRSALDPRLALPWRKGEGRRWPASEGWHDSPIVRGGWLG